MFWAKARSHDEILIPRLKSRGYLYGILSFSIALTLRSGISNNNGKLGFSPKLAPVLRFDQFFGKGFDVHSIKVTRAHK